MTQEPNDQQTVFPPIDEIATGIAPPVIPTDEEVAAAADAYAQALALKTALDEAYKPLFAAFQEQYRELIDMRVAASKAFEAQDKALRDAVLAYYNLSGIGAPAIPGVKVTLDSIAEFDNDTLLNYAIAHELREMLMIDTKFLKGVAVAILSSRSGTRPYAADRLMEDWPVEFKKKPTVELSQKVLMLRAQTDETEGETSNG